MTLEELVILIADCKRNNDMAPFYTSKEWRRLRATVIKEQKGECQHCRHEGYYTPATTVHHEQRVRSHPKLALSTNYIDSEGNIKRQLTALCDACHKEIHNRLLEKETITLERWD